MSATKKYTAAPGSRLKDEDAETIGVVVDRIATERGDCKPEDLLEEARSESSPLHPYFEWNNRKAADAYRLDRARYLIRSIRIVIETQDAPVETRAFHVVTQGDERGYRPAAQVFAQEDLARQVIATALRDLRGWTARYQQYRKVAKLAPVFDAIDGALKEQQDLPIAAE